MAAAPNRTPREVVDFAPNVPVIIALKYAQPKMVGGINGERFMFSTCDNRVFFVDPEVAGQITALGVNVRENFSLTKRWDSAKGSSISWEVARVAGEQPNGTLVVPSTGGARPPVAATAVSPKPPASAASSRGDALVESAIEAVDAYAAVLEYALTKFQGRLKPDEVQRLFTTVYIQKRQYAA